MAEHTAMNNNIMEEMGESVGRLEFPPSKKTKTIQGIRDIPNPEVREKAVRHSFTAEYKLRNKPLHMSFEDHLKALVYFHLEDHTSAQYLLQVLKEDAFARNEIAPRDGIKKSSFSEATNSRGLEQFWYVFTGLQEQARKVLPNRHLDLGPLVAIDGSLINATLSMH